MDTDPPKVSSLNWGISLATAVLIHDTLDGRALACGRLTRNFLDAALVAHVVPSPSRTLLVLPDGTLMLARHVRSQTTYFHFPQHAIDKQDTRARELFEEQRHLLF
eukprot:NODE_1835_length_1056_cov_28.783515_g1494_i0.p2 GENE.NODE_1835_length_1056_cov_28.783515_g1494_i0~~NODE_1835_length_1056_cov_28.783515_g1494_i0.p2  ORF type:complete len:106 (+),score=12.40 NODE_1835_length_1056_cov_28.783515_g1494_i0:641-958(+)